MRPSAKDSASSALNLGFFTAEGAESFAEGRRGISNQIYPRLEFIGLANQESATIGCDSGQKLPFGRSVVLGGFFPVDQAPPGLEIIGTAILVFQIVGVFPHVAAEHGSVAFHQLAVLVGCVD